MADLHSIQAWETACQASQEWADQARNEAFGRKDMRRMELMLLFFLITAITGGIALEILLG